MATVRPVIAFISVSLMESGAFSLMKPKRPLIPIASRQKIRCVAIRGDSRRRLQAVARLGSAGRGGAALVNRERRADEVAPRECWKSRNRILKVKISTQDRTHANKLSGLSNLHILLNARP